MARRWFAFLVGSLAAVMGLMVHLPTRVMLFIPQLLLNEFSWLVTLGGFTAAGIGLRGRPRSYVGSALGMIGGLLAFIPYLQIWPTIRGLDSAMRYGLGEHYEDQIPPLMFQRMARWRWSPRVALSGRGKPGNVRRLDDVTYAQPGERALMIDVYLPDVPPINAERYPAIIVVHGGSWHTGDKREFFNYNSRYLAHQGYVVFDIQYRLAPEAAWPAQLEDVRRAIRWVKQHASLYQVDPDRLVLLGRSAGGHLALLAAYRADAEHSDTQVKAVVAFYPPTDLRLWESVPESAITKFLGGLAHEMPDAYVDASPIEFVRENPLPPTLLIQGDMDNLVKPVHVELLNALLKPTGTRVVTLRIPWGRHGFDAPMAGLGSQLVQYDIDRFLAWILYGDRSVTPQD